MDKKLPLDKQLRKIYYDFKRAWDDKKAGNEAMKEDAEFTLGKQWDDKDVADLKSNGIRALTINKCRINVQLLAGLESQNRTDFLAFPEGAEDSLKAEVATGLLKNVMKKASGNYVISEQFEDGCACGESYIEPYMDYTYDFVSGVMKFRKWNFDCIFPEPGKNEYDLSDRNYICKLVRNLSEEELKQLFPDKEKEIKKLTAGKLNIDNFQFDMDAGTAHIQGTGYPDKTSTVPGEDPIEQRYDLLEYYYKKVVKKYFIVDRKIPIPKEMRNKEEAEQYVSQVIALDKPGSKPSAVFVERMVPEIWIASVVGNTILSDEKSWSYPRYKYFPIFPIYAYRSTMNIDSKEYLIQGITRGLKDLNRELNKRRTQELRIINSSANSGWLSAKGAFVDKEEVRKKGSTAGFIIEYQPNMEKPEKIMPTPLSAGHSKLAEENTQDMKEASGINTDLLAMNEKQASGRAIHLRQKQGMVMVQKLFDNLSQTKKLIGKFIVSQLGELYDIDSAVRVMGDAFIMENFMKPKLIETMDPATGQPTQQPQVDPVTKQLVMEPDAEMIAETFGGVLSDSGIVDYDIAVGEGSNNETIRFANYMVLMEMVEKGIPIPPDILVEESMLSSAHKKKIANAIEQAQQAQAQQAQAESAGKPAK